MNQSEIIDVIDKLLGNDANSSAIVMVREQDIVTIVASSSDSIITSAVSLKNTENAERLIKTALEVFAPETFGLYINKPAKKQV